GYARAEHARDGRPLYPDHHRNAGEPDAQAAGPAERVRGSLLPRQQPAKHRLPRQGEGVLGRGSELEFAFKARHEPAIDQAAFVRRLIFFWSIFRSARARSYCICIPSQTCGLPPKAAARRIAMSGEMPVWPFTTLFSVWRVT